MRLPNVRWPWQRVEIPAPAVSFEAVMETAVHRAAEQTALRVRAEVAEEVRGLLAQGASPIPELPAQVGQAPYGAFAFDRPWQYYTPTAPRRKPDALVDVDTLRQLADSYDILRSCIQHIKREVSAVPLDIVAVDDSADEAKSGARIQEAKRFFGMRGGLGGHRRRRSQFESELIEDLFVIGASAIYLQPTLGKRGIAEAVAIDAATIRPRVDAWGWPGPGEVAYEQWIQGMRVAEFTDDELIYDGLYPVSYSPYFKSPVEYLIHVVHSALRADGWNRDWLTDGNTPTDLFTLPENWTPEQIQSWQNHWDQLLSGDSKARQRAKFLPSGSQRVGAASRKDQEFSTFELWLMRRCCAIIGVQPASIGFAGEQYKVSQEKSTEVTTDIGVGVVLDWRVEIYNELLCRNGFEDLQAQNVKATAGQSRERAETNVRLVGGGIKTPNEARAEEGLEPIEGGGELLVPNTLRPLSQALEPPPPVMPGGKAVAEGQDEPDDRKAATQRALQQWERKALNRLRAGKAARCSFESEVIPCDAALEIEGALLSCEGADDVRAIFRAAVEGGKWVTIGGRPVFIKDKTGGGEATSASETKTSKGQDGVQVRVPGRAALASTEAAKQSFALHTHSLDAKTGEGGSTFSLYEGNLLGRQIHAVSLFPDLGDMIPANEFTETHIAGFVDAHREIFEDPRVAVGTWLEGGMVYLDVTALVPDREQAISLGKQYNQIGIFDLGKVEYIHIGGNGNAPADMPPPGDRLKGIPSWL